MHQFGAYWNFNRTSLVRLVQQPEKDDAEKQAIGNEGHQPNALEQREKRGDAKPTGNRGKQQRHAELGPVNRRIAAGHAQRAKAA